MPRSPSDSISPGATSRTGAEHVERAALGRDAVAVAQLAERKRAQPERVAEGDDRLAREHHDRESALQARQDGLHGVLDGRALVRRQQRRDDLGVRAAEQADAVGRQLLAQLDRVDQVAVVRQRHLAPVRAMDRLRVLPVRRARRRVAHVPDRGLARQRAQLLLVEDLRDEPALAQRRDVPLVADRDSRRLLTAVLERVEREVRQPRYVRARRVHAENAALVARPVAIGAEVVEGGHSKQRGSASV